MVKVIGVRFRDVGKLYYFDPVGLDIRAGERVVVETARGTECGYVGMGVREVPDESIVKPLKEVIRKATPEDIERHDENRKKEKEAYDICKRKIIEHKLEMKLVDVEYAFDGQHILFYFTADGRVDFRDLVKDLATVFRTRIELRQIGVRDESKLLGGIGMCGKPFCCSTFLFDFQPVSIKMAKEQGKSLNPAKISGTCGRLMCCLKYEQDVYEELTRLTPKVGAIVKTPDGEGLVVESNVLATSVKVRMDRSDSGGPRIYKAGDVDVIGGKGFKKQASEENAPAKKPEPARKAPAAKPPVIKNLLGEEPTRAAENKGGLALAQTGAAPEKHKRPKKRRPRYSGDKKADK